MSEFRRFIIVQAEIVQVLGIIGWTFIGVVAGQQMANAYPYLFRFGQIYLDETTVRNRGAAPLVP
jgi:hypothetical protein